MGMFNEGIHEKIDRIQGEASAGRKFERDVRTIVKVFLENRPGETGIQEGDPVSEKLVDGLTALFDYLEASDRGITTPGSIRKSMEETMGKTQ